jgi:hypothetical protein
MKFLRFHGKRRELVVESVSSFPEKKQKRLSASRILSWIRMRPRRATLFASFSGKRRALAAEEVSSFPEEAKAFVRFADFKLGSNEASQSYAFCFFF